MVSILNQDVLHYFGDKPVNSITAQTSIAYDASAHTLIFTDLSTYATPDTGGSMQVTVYDKFGGQLSASSVLTSGAIPAITISTAGLNATFGFAAQVTVVSNLRSVRSGTFTGIAASIVSGSFNF